jgi:hypothetical protein
LLVEARAGPGAVYVWAVDIAGGVTIEAPAGVEASYMSASELLGEKRSDAGIDWRQNGVVDEPDATHRTRVGRLVQRLVWCVPHRLWRGNNLSTLSIG